MGSDSPKIEPSCTNCKWLRDCHIVTERLLRMGFRCDRYTSVPDTEFNAREDIVDDFGPWALRYEVESLKRRSVHSKIIRRRKKNV